MLFRSLPVLLRPDRKHKARPPVLHGKQVIRAGDRKLIATRGGRGVGADRKVNYGTELYNLKKDPSQKNNRSEERRAGNKCSSRRSPYH